MVIDLCTMKLIQRLNGLPGGLQVVTYMLLIWTFYLIFEIVFPFNFVGLSMSSTAKAIASLKSR